MESSGFVWMRAKSRIQHKSSAVSLKSVAHDLTQIQFSPCSSVIQDVLALFKIYKVTCQKQSFRHSTFCAFLFGIRLVSMRTN